MTTRLDSYDRVHMLQMIEDAMRDARYCACGELMTVQADGDTLWLECPSFIQPSTGRLAWLRDGMREYLHQRDVIARDFGIAA